ncbi:MAG: pilin [Candidatus Saccharimonadales bacterium]
MMHIYHYLAQIDTNSLPNHGNGDVASTALSTVLQIVFGVTGAIALLVITIAGFRYVVSQGDPNSVAQAKNTIIYALVGLLISIAAFSIVTFVVKGVS